MGLGSGILRVVFLLGSHAVLHAADCSGNDSASACKAAHCGPWLAAAPRNLAAGVARLLSVVQKITSAYLTWLRSAEPPS
ncbi:hypothetical protein CYMTET_17058 [Cymbomonas tetramitiformis]|uniref:Uncharacterized protein n=1 Tax=Cymbomonas tetramitiformis TaxID=36881 RepID=A0AAE0L7B9_9CHLO|nr:hypothetical protein CYMTET_17058 [Cymbomonas tetramitiformis]